MARGYWIYYKAAATAIAPGLSFVRPAAHVSNRCKSGIRSVHSIQTEGHFGDIKENESFRRFNYRSEEKVYKEFMLYAIGRNIMKYHWFLHHEIETYEGKKEQTIPERIPALKSMDSMGLSPHRLSEV
ncbi:Transposase DDE domain-containing protein [Lachnospiraceae bacterium NLAE-zl-G231]|nr:Transposase DDE domain-containing protein [Lachnospiraceae bacterium NLAE-zl-G231]